jgi:hypothetical protein
MAAAALASLRRQDRGNICPRRHGTASRVASYPEAMTDRGVQESQALTRTRLAALVAVLVVAFLVVVVACLALWLVLNPHLTD